MEARLLRGVIAVFAFCSLGASYRTANFVVSAPTQQFAEQVGNEAERFRRELAILWLGEPLPKWAQPCPITLQVGPHLGAGGATSFVFDRGEVFNWQMSIQGSEERILDSVLPHEVTHTIFASYFRQPLPRWADEGACTTVEHESERSKQRQMLISFLKEDRGIAFNRMFAMKEYPADVMPLYAQGYSVCRFLIDQRDRRTFIRFLSEGMETNAWGQALNRHYGFQDLSQLQTTWLDWVRAGSPLQRKTPAPDSQPILAANQTQPQAPRPAVDAAAMQVASAATLHDKLVPIRRPENLTPQGLAASPPTPAVDTAVQASQAVQLTRPQEPQRVRPQVLEWSQQPAGTAPLPSRPQEVAASPARANQAATPGSRIRLSESAAQRYLPSAMSRPKRPPANNQAQESPPAIAANTTGEI